MRVAICLSGLVRTYRETFENYKQCLIDCNPNCDFDVFISTWSIEHSNTSTERTRRVAWYGESHPLFPENAIDYQDICNKYKPKAIKVIEPIEFEIHPNFQIKNPVNLQSILSMTYQILSCKELMLNHYSVFHRNYDAVIRHRFDTLIPFPIIIQHYDLTKITVPSMMQPCIIDGAQWINDKFALGSFEDMRIYSDWFYRMRQSILSGMIVQPEVMLKEFIDEYFIETVPLGQEFEMVRPKGY